MVNNVLSKYYKENNPLVERLTVKSRVMHKLLFFIICSILFPLFTLSKRYHNIYGEEIQGSNIIGIINIIMLICIIISVIGVIWIVLCFSAPEFIRKLSTKISFTIKKVIFNILDWGIIFPICCTIAVFCYSYLFIITPISGNSMNPTIQDGDNILISYNAKIERFSVVVVEVNSDDNFHVDGKSYYIKRIIGMPGDIVKWENKKLYINNKLIDEYYLKDGYLDSIYLTENFVSDFKYKNEAGEECRSAIIPEGYYFVMGDNRAIDGSKDSRKIGLIPDENIIGVAKYFMKTIIPWGEVK